MFQFKIPSWCILYRKISIIKILKYLYDLYIYIYIYKSHNFVFVYSKQYYNVYLRQKCNLIASTFLFHKNFISHTKRVKNIYEINNRIQLLCNLCFSTFVNSDTFVCIYISSSSFKSQLLILVLKYNQEEKCVDTPCLTCYFTSYIKQEI